MSYRQQHVALNGREYIVRFGSDGAAFRVLVRTERGPYRRIVWVNIGLSGPVGLAAIAAAQQEQAA